MALFGKSKDKGSDKAKEEVPEPVRQPIAAAPPPRPAAPPQPAPARPQAQSAPVASAPPTSAPGAGASTEATNSALPVSPYFTAFGEIVFLFARASQAPGVPVGQLDLLLSPAIQAGQFIIARAQAPNSNLSMPVAAAVWANVNQEVDGRLSSELDKPIMMQPQEWQSGDIPWLIAAVGDGAVVRPMLDQIQTNILKEKPLKMRYADPTGAAKVGLLADLPV